ncbi:hypothetical protein PC9H_008596 [Pleurotus ostreatus]|uniref:Carbohydrate-binding module family 13 protein n=3 Tax=Pleurotus TaxID=5320 RepID=A0A8H6ZRL4_PLEOS|nr:uncharacterized protein PC9H_008596 [Pleurotus ostreatus]KAF7426229.1 hypothetical protein PC9H_008596 [Pleurotus ostreatus]KAJ8693694.1 hypothetical protein PTI98_008669 [Pleurotus ostreatus]
MFKLQQILLTVAFSFVVNGQYSATYLPSNVPKTTEQGQAGTNQCGTSNSQTSMCQNAYLNSVDDFCLWGPPEPNSVIGNSEREVVSWCLKPGTGSRLIPAGSIKGAHFVQTPDFIQVTGTGDLTSLNIQRGDAGGELDPHGADGNGNPIGGLVFSTAFGQLQQVHEWTQFISSTDFCFRACTGKSATKYCEHIYDVMGCNWNMPADYSAGKFENCKGDSGEPMGIYGASTFHQGEPATPAAHPRPKTSGCVPIATIGGDAAPPASSSVIPSSSSAPTSTVGSPSSATPLSSPLSSAPSSASTGTAQPTGSSSSPLPALQGSSTSGSAGSSAPAGPVETGNAAASLSSSHQLAATIGSMLAVSVLVSAIRLM